MAPQSRVILQTIVWCACWGWGGGGGEVLKKRFFGQCRWIFPDWLVFIKKTAEGSLYLIL